MQKGKEVKASGIHICAYCGRPIFEHEATYIKTARRTELWVCEECMEKSRKRNDL